jgi:23S rRNA pseudouridine955/2504/2580 synthase
MAKVTWIDVGEDEAGQRIDNYLLARLKGVPKTHVYRILRSGEVRINSRRVEASQRVAAGDRIRVPPVRVAERDEDVPAPGRALPGTGAPPGPRHLGRAAGREETLRAHGTP